MMLTTNLSTKTTSKLKHNKNYYSYNRKMMKKMIRNNNKTIKIQIKMKIQKKINLSLKIFEIFNFQF